MDKSIMDRLVQAGLPDSTAADLTVRSLTNNQGPVTQPKLGNWVGSEAHVKALADLRRGRVDD